MQFKDATARLYDAINRSDVSAASNALDDGAHVNDCEHKTFYTPLHRAAALNSPELIALLLERGADANACDCWHDTPLHHAAKRASADTIAILIAHGAQVDAINGDRKAPADIARDHNRADIVALLAPATGHSQTPAPASPTKPRRARPGDREFHR